MINVSRSEVIRRETERMPLIRWTKWTNLQNMVPVKRGIVTLDRTVVSVEQERFEEEIASNELLDVDVLTPNWPQTTT